MTRAAASRAGAYLLGFSGIVTFKNAGEVREAAASPIDRLLVETDAPYLAPVPHRGRPNQPALVRGRGRGRGRRARASLGRDRGVHVARAAERLFRVWTAP